MAAQEAGRVSDVELKRLIDEAVERAVRAILRGERALEAGVAPAVRERLQARAGPAEGEVAALETRIADVERRLVQADERHGRSELRVDEIAHHVGHREALDVSRVPPAILERAFQGQLDEIAAELAKTRGTDEVERALDGALADVRGHSKGAELFERRGPRIEIAGLGAALQRKLISPRAAQATFEEIVKHLRSHLPGFRPRPLSATIRLRGAEFAVEAAVAHHARLAAAEERLATLIAETRRIEEEAKAADTKAAESTSRSMMTAAMERRTLEQSLHGRIAGLEKRAALAEERLEQVLSRLEAAERYTQRVEGALIRRTKEGTFKGDFTPVIDAVHDALKDGKARSIGDLAKRVKGVDREVVEAVVREAVKEGVFEETKGGLVRLVR